ncbi:MAG: biotin/lipoyl-containing protein [Candidatus Fimivivens sp.]|nr:biotin/lipoyl-containing protein [Candidatus Fimivivens sp.]
MKYVVTLNGKDYEVEVSQGSAQVLSVSAAGTAAPVSTPVRAAAPAAVPAPAPVAAPATPAAGKAVNAPMPGTVLKMLVKQGDKVTNGQVLLVLEAMKMENEIFAPCDGTVTSVAVKEGSSVNSGDAMVTIG